MNPTIHFDPELVRRYDTGGPRYTSYPNVPWFRDSFGPEEYVACATETDHRRPLSLYFRLPCCATTCFHCACNQELARNRAHAGPCLERLGREIDLQAGLFGDRPSVDQLHWAGGTPTFLDPGRIEWLFGRIARAYPLRTDDLGDYSVELDPGAVDDDAIRLLRQLGFNHASLAVQDLNHEVQRAVNCIQPEAVTRATLDACRAAGFRSLNIDLIYGLPLQTLHSFTRTIDRVIELAPGRIALHNHADLPARFAPQGRIPPEDLPSPAERLEILRLAIEHLAAAGYVCIGMGQFTRPDDALARAQREGTLTRNLQGYSTHTDCDIVAHGISGIGMFGDCYSQNSDDRERYDTNLDADCLPIARGLRLSADDRLRRELITRLICDFELDVAGLERRYGIDFAGTFGPECEALEPLVADGLVEWRGRRLTVTAVGRLLVRSVAMVFDRYLQHDHGSRWSWVI